MARNRKAKQYASLAVQSAAQDGGATATPAIVATVADAPTQSHGQGGNEAVAPLPLLEPWVEGDLKLQQLAKRIEIDFLNFCDLARQAIKDGWHTRFGYVDPGAYFEERICLSYRTLRRRFSVLEAIERLPEAERAEARSTMVELGSHKAAALAPMLGEEGVDWRKEAEFARRATEDAVQSRVSEKLGHPHRGLPASQYPGQRFMERILNQVPPEEHDRVQWVFSKLMAMAGSHNPMAVFLVLVGLGEQELAASGIVRDAPDAAQKA